MLVRRKDIFSVSLRFEKLSDIFSASFSNSSRKVLYSGQCNKTCVSSSTTSLQEKHFCHLYSPHYSAKFDCNRGSATPKFCHGPTVCPNKNCFAIAFHIKICSYRPIKSKFIPTSTSACILSIYISRPLIYIPLCYKW